MAVAVAEGCLMYDAMLYVDLYTRSIRVVAGDPALIGAVALAGISRTP